MAGGEGNVPHGLQREEDGGAGTMGKGGGGMGKTQGVGGGHKIKGEEGRGWQWGASCLASTGGTCSQRGVAGDCNCGGDNGNSEGGSMDKKLANLANMQWKETREN